MTKEAPGGKQDELEVNSFNKETTLEILFMLEPLANQWWLNLNQGND